MSARKRDGKRRTPADHPLAYGWRVWIGPRPARRTAPVEPCSSDEVTREDGEASPAEPDADREPPDG